MFRPAVWLQRSTQCDAGGGDTDPERGAEDPDRPTRTADRSGRKFGGRDSFQRMLLGQVDIHRQKKKKKQTLDLIQKLTQDENIA